MEEGSVPTELAQLPSPAARGLALLDPAHLALAHVERVALHGGEHVSLEVLLQLPDLALEVATRVASFSIPIVVPAGTALAALVVISLTDQRENTSSLFGILPGSGRRRLVSGGEAVVNAKAARKGEGAAAS